MNDTITISRSLEEGKYILRDGECWWRVNADGAVECTAQGHARVSSSSHSFNSGKHHPASHQMILHWKISQADRHDLFRPQALSRHIFSSRLSAAGSFKEIASGAAALTHIHVGSPGILSLPTIT